MYQTIVYFDILTAIDANIVFRMGRAKITTDVWGLLEPLRLGYVLLRWHGFLAV